jgi:phosphoribosylglycinamide formyltransferase 1
MNIALFASGAGSNVNNIINYFKYDETNKVNIVLSNNLNSGALTFAKDNNIDTYVFNKDELCNTNLVLDIIKKYDIDLIVLAGFLLKIPKQFIDNFNGKIINIHPSLLPKYGGKGMYGINIHNAVIKNKEKQSGITIHYVNENYDEGNIIAQHKINLLNNETPESLLEKIKILEKQYYSKTIRNLSYEK